MKVKEWIAYDEMGDRKQSVGWMGGFFNWETKGMRWKDYLAHFDPAVHPYLEAIRESVLEHKICFGGDVHQQHPEGVPLFEDDTVAHFTYRAWGDLMAAIWSEAHDTDYTYMTFYMGNKCINLK
jgi:hypothetical protein